MGVRAWAVVAVSLTALTALMWATGCLASGNGSGSGSGGSGGSAASASQPPGVAADGDLIAATRRCRP